MSKITLTQLNIEGSRHLSRVIPFLQKESPDVVCIQEIQELDIPTITHALGYVTDVHFLPMLRITEDGVTRIEGCAIFSKFPISQKTSLYYTDTAGMREEYDETDAESKHRTQSCGVAVCEIEKEGVLFRIATTHFTWTHDGLPNALQREDLAHMLSHLAPLGELVFTGDFNAPRGGEIFSLLEEKFTDNVPLHYTTSIDATLHRAGDLQLMVDGIFSTPEYTVSDVAMVCGVSDHCALVAKISKE